MSREDEDEEILAIKQRKLTEMQKSAITRSAMNSITRPIVLTDMNFRDEVLNTPSC